MGLFDGIKKQREIQREREERKQKAKEQQQKEQEEARELERQKAEEYKEKEIRAREDIKNFARTQKMSKELIELRTSKRWKMMYERNLGTLSVMKGRDRQERFLEMIDKMASASPVDQNNILAGFDDWE